MTYKIVDTCISCGACEPACPVGAISEGSDYYEIDPAVCVECKGHFDVSQCAEVCPTESCVPA